MSYPICPTKSGPFELGIDRDVVPLCRLRGPSKRRVAVAGLRRIVSLGAASCG